MLLTDARVCWAWEPTMCGRVTWDFPIWEVLATLILTALVTFITVRVSVSQARKETDRVLAHERLSERAAAISEVVAAFQERTSVSAMAALEDAATTARFVLGLARIRTSNAPFADEAAAWVEMVEMVEGFDPERTMPVDLDEFGNAMFRRAPAAVVAKRLTRWHEDPQREGPSFKTDVEALEPWFKKRVAEELAKEEAAKLKVGEDR